MTLAISIVSYSIGAAVFFLSLCLFLIYRAQLTKYFLIVQGLFLANIALNGVYEYIHINLHGSPQVLAVWSVIAFLWAPFFFYFSLIYVFHLSALTLAGWVRNLLRGTAVLVGLSIAIPVLAWRGADDFARNLERLVFSINIPLVVLSGVVALVLMPARYRQTENALVRGILLNHIVLEVVGLPIIVALWFVDLAAGLYMEPRLKAAIDLFGLAWNLQMAGQFVRFARRIECEPLDQAAGTPALGRLRKAGYMFSDTLRKYEKSGVSPLTAEAVLGRLERLMEEKRPYLMSDLTLVRLAASLSVPRNQLSQILNEYRRQSFNDFLNSYRVNEAKRLLTAGDGPANVLEVAFNSGFNSKTTFYRVFRASTGLTPTEYAARRTGEEAEVGRSAAPPAREEMRARRTGAPPILP